ncbi:MAG: hypothetical protein SGI94_05690 [Saprospiraceae bacterium]|nr:hypothetical protein [Saprospiraceae bacterium]
MAVLGNIFLTLATFIYVFILASAYGDKPPQSGDAAGGYPMGIILFKLAFLGCMVITAVAVGWTGGFDWISSDKSAKFALAALGLLAITFVAAWSALFKFEPMMPWSVRYLTGIAPALFPAVLLLAAAVLLNAPIREIIPVPVYKIPLILVFGISVMTCLAGIVEWVMLEQQHAGDQVSTELSDQERYRQDHLSQIAAANPATVKDLINILVFTDGNHDGEVRKKALEKIKSNPNWQQVLVEALQNENAPQVFTFLASNPVDDKALFAEPVREGILQLAANIRHSIRQCSHPSHFYADQFSWDIDRMLATVENFKDMGVDYLPAMREVRAALNQPSDPPGLKRVEFKVVSTLDWWIKQSEKSR